MYYEANARLTTLNEWLFFLNEWLFPLLDRKVLRNSYKAFYSFTILKMELAFPVLTCTK